MTIKEGLTCPRCQANGLIKHVELLFDDTRYDALVCPDCGVEWRVYYKIQDVNAEVTYVPEGEENMQETPREDTLEVTDDMIPEESPILK